MFFMSALSSNKASSSVAVPSAATTAGYFKDVKSRNRRERDVVMTTI